MRMLAGRRRLLVVLGLLALLTGGCSKGMVVDLPPLELPSEYTKNIGSETLEYYAKAEVGYVAWSLSQRTGRTRHTVVWSNEADLEDNFVVFGSDINQGKDISNDNIEVALAGFFQRKGIDWAVICGYVHNPDVRQLQVFTTRNTWLIQVYDGRFLGAKSGVRISTLARPQYGAINEIVGLSADGEELFRTPVFLGLRNK